MSTSKPTPVAEEMEYITLPELDMYDYPFPDIWHNKDKFERGKTYLVAKPIAEEVKRRIEIFEAQNLRLMQPRKDLKAIQDAAAKRS